MGKGGDVRTACSRRSMLVHMAEKSLAYQRLGFADRSVNMADFILVLCDFSENFQFSIFKKTLYKVYKR